MITTLPLLVELADDLKDFYRSISPYYQDPTQYYHRYPIPISSGDNQRFRHRRFERRKGESRSTVGKDGFQVSMDVQHFKPSELAVKVVDDCVVIDGKHEEREDDHGYISRHFTRRYKLPKGYDSSKVISTLSSDGVLTVNVPKPQIENKPHERIIQIQQVGPAHLNVKENTADSEQEIQTEPEPAEPQTESEKKTDS